LQRAIRKYGAECFTIRVLERCARDHELKGREVYWIAKLDAYRHGYNETLGGDGGSGTKWKAAVRAALARPETRHNISIARRKMWKSPGYRQKHKTALQAAMARPEYKRKRAAGMARPEVKRKMIESGRTGGNKKSAVAARRRARLKKGLCSTCGKRPRWKGHRCCKKHHLYYAQLKRLSYARQKKIHRR
jgi:hypothetical protein